MKKLVFLIFPLFLLVIFLFNLSPVNAQYGLDISAGKAGYSKSETPYTITTTFVNAALALVYIVFFILILYSGIRWMTAQGNEEHVTKAKNILEAAIIGLVVISAAYAITNFVLGKVGAGGSSPTNPGTVSPPSLDQPAADDGLPPPPPPPPADPSKEQISYAAESVTYTYCCNIGARQCMLAADQLTDIDEILAANAACLSNFSCAQGACSP